jgi:hypothetical protein
LNLRGEAIEEFLASELEEEWGGGFDWEFHDSGDDGFEGAILYERLRQRGGRSGW